MKRNLAVIVKGRNVSNFTVNASRKKYFVLKIAIVTTAETINKIWLNINRQSFKP